jgi:hypothetical protein
MSNIDRNFPVQVGYICTAAYSIPDVLVSCNVISIGLFSTA